MTLEGVVLRRRGSVFVFWGDGVLGKMGDQLLW